MFTPILIAQGYTGYQVLKNTEDAQRRALSDSVEVANETAYAKERLSQISTSDEFVADRRLLEVALTAYGLESEIDKTAFIKRALDEGTTDDAAFANLLSDSRWVDFSRDFGFGDLNSASNMKGFRAIVETRFRVDAEDADAKLDPFKLNHYRTNIGSVASIDDLLADDILLDVALAAFDLERGYYTDDHFRQLLTEGVDDTVNDYAYGLGDDRWVSFATAFTGLADGQTLETVTPFRLDVERELARREVPLYDAAEADASSSKLKVGDIVHFQLTADGVASAADIVADAQLKEVTLAAYGLAGTSLSDAEITNILDSAVAGDLAPAQAQSDTAWSQLAISFAESINGGPAAEVKQFEYMIELGIAEQKLEPLAYLEDDSDPVSRVDADDLAYFSETIEDVESIDAFLADDRLVDVALRAFGLENEGKSTDYLKSILEEDPTDESAFVNQLSDDRWAKFANAYNGVGAQSAIWRDEIEQRLIERDASTEDLEYFRDNWSLVGENLDLVLLPELMDIVLSAFDIPKNSVSTEFFLSMVISDPSDDNSLLNLVDDDRWRAVSDLMGSYVGVGGNTADNEFQSELLSNYEAKRFEIAVGEQDGAMRLALNFERLIGNFTEKDNWFSILGDQPIRNVLDAALGMPSGFVNVDIEEQNRAYSERAKELFGGDTPAIFSDPDKISDAIRRYMIAQSNSANYTTPGYGALTLMSSAVSNARSFNQTA